MIHNDNFDIFIIHATHATERKEHTLKELGNKFSQFEFIIDGDVKDLNSELLEMYFKGSRMTTPAPVSSCAIKHLFALENLLQSPNNFALIVEDDLFFYKNHTVISKVINEISQRKLKNFMISLEDSLQRYVPKSKRVKNQFIYLAPKCRGGGCYLVDKKAAYHIITNATNNKVDKPIDLLYNQLARDKVIDMYWSHPAIAVQGSINGKMPSMLDSKKHGLAREISYLLTAMYKRFLYLFR